MALPAPRTYVSVCTGVGGLDLGLHAEIPGLEPVVYIEREAHAAAVLVARMERSKRAKVHREAARLKAKTAGRLMPAEKYVPGVVMLVRVSARPLDDDNLRGALKSVRDGVADWLDVDDRDPRVTWEYAQEKGPQKLAHVRVECRQR